jgi:hypothetical protein
MRTLTLLLMWMMCDSGDLDLPMGKFPALPMPPVQRAIFVGLDYHILD